jgi:hypothetical protein
LFESATLAVTVCLGFCFRSTEAGAEDEEEKDDDDDTDAVSSCSLSGRIESQASAAKVAVVFERLCPSDLRFDETKKTARTTPATVLTKSNDARDTTFSTAIHNQLGPLFFFFVACTDTTMAYGYFFK